MLHPCPGPSPGTATPPRPLPSAAQASLGKQRLRAEGPSDNGMLTAKAPKKGDPAIQRMLLVQLEETR